MSNKLTLVSGTRTYLPSGTTYDNDSDSYATVVDGGFVLWDTFESPGAEEAYAIGINGSGAPVTSTMPVDFPNTQQNASGLATMTNGEVVGGLIEDPDAFPDDDFIIGITQGDAIKDFRIDEDLTTAASFEAYAEEMEIVALSGGGFAVLAVYENSFDDDFANILYYSATGTLRKAVSINALFPGQYLEFDSVQLSESPSGGVSALIALDDFGTGLLDTHFVINVDANGNPSGAPIKIVDENEEEDLYHDNDLAVLRDGRVVVAYEGDAVTPDGATQIYVKIVSADGTQVSDKILVSTGLNIGDFNEYASVVATKDGGFIVGWHHDFDDGEVVYLRRFDAAGNPMGAPELVDGQTNESDHVDLAIGPDGELIVSFGGEASEAAIYQVEEVPSIYDDKIVGTPGNDSFSLLDGNDLFFGFAGDDIVFGGGGVDSLFGGADDDSLFGGSSGDILRGGSGEDRMSGGRGNDNMKGQGNADKMRGDVGADTMKGNRGDDRMQGNRGNDELFGNKGNDKVTGNKGSDEVFGGKGSDRVFGGKGNDDVYGNRGNDKIGGGKGNDDLYGGTGADQFVFQGGDGKDVIHDFDVNRDEIVINGQSSYEVAQSGNNLIISYGNDNEIKLKGIGLDDFSDSLIDIG